jgi:Zn-finger nucleic acid-binding protein
MSAIKEGEVVLCPDCSVEIATIAKYFEVGDQILATHFDFKTGHELRDGTPRCNKCGGMWLMYGGQLKIKDRGLVP